MKISKIRDVKTPERGTSRSAGIDFFIPNDYTSKDPIPDYMNPLVLKPHDFVLIPSGIKVNVPKGFMLCAFNKSGIATKRGLTVGACVVDEDYQGEIHLHLINNSNKKVILKNGDKIVQFILIPVNYTDIEIIEEEELFKVKTDRGIGGFGSTGT